MQNRTLSIIASVMTLLLPMQVFAATLDVTQQSAISGSIPKGAQRVTFLSLTLTAGCDDAVTIDQLTVVHEGLGDSADVSRVYVTDGRRRLTRGRAFDTSDQTAMVRFIPKLTLAKCETRTLLIVADLSSDAQAAGEHRLYVELPTDIQTTADVTLSGLIAERPSIVRPRSTGTVNVHMLDLLQPLRFGNDRTLARFRLEASGDRDQDIGAITFTNDGKATDTDLQNLRIQNRKGDSLTPIVAAMDGDRVHLMFDPILRLDRNDTILLELKGDIRVSKRRTVRFMLEEPSDLEASPRAR